MYYLHLRAKNQPPGAEEPKPYLRRRRGETDDMTLFTGDCNARSGAQNIVELVCVLGTSSIVPRR